MKWSRTPHLRQLIDMALSEDQVGLDITSAVFFAEEVGRATVVAKEPLVMAGQGVVTWVYERLDDRVCWQPEVEDGQSVEAGQVVARVEGPARALLSGERVALNFLQRLSGVATLTARYVDALEGTAIRLADTRKTVPGWRALDKYAVRCGGGTNHRYHLAAGVMVKENHIAAAKGIAEAVARVKELSPHTLAVEVEVETIDEAREAVNSGADVVMLDNMDNETMAQAVGVIRRHRRGDDVVIEASGNMDRKRLRTLGGIGLDVVSVGALTHSAPAVDLSMRWEDDSDG